MSPKRSQEPAGEACGVIHQRYGNGAKADCHGGVVVASPHGKFNPTTQSTSLFAILALFLFLSFRTQPNAVRRSLCFLPESLPSSHVPSLGIPRFLNKEIYSDLVGGLFESPSGSILPLRSFELSGHPVGETLRANPSI